MLDKSIPYTGVLMINENPAEYPRFELPAGFLISGYQPGFEFAWADLHMEIEQFETRAEGVQMYRREFFTHPERQKENCLFVIDEEDQVAAVGALWTGDHFGRTLPRIHWIAAHPRHQGKGLVKALLTRLGRNPTLEEIALELNQTPEDTALLEKMLTDVRTAAKAKAAQEPKSEDPDDDKHVEDTAYFQMRQRIMELLSGLSDRDAEILTLRYGLEGGLPMSAQETGAKLGLTSEEVVSREAAALAQLRNER